MLALAFLWHHHQPYYPDDITGENIFPWVRLHGVKDYYGMARILQEVPEVKCTINLVPSLLIQLEAYASGLQSDRLFEVCSISADSLGEEEQAHLLATGFLTDQERMIKPWPRYWELYLRQQANMARPSSPTFNFTPQELRDLQTLCNLVWIHPLELDRDPDLASLCKKGSGYTEEEKKLVLNKHLEIIKTIIPLHRELADRGQIELTTSPFFHPILPLLLDKKLAREANPDIKLPRNSNDYPGDALWHVREAVSLHDHLFGAKPKGMWPSEGGVCQAMIPILAGAGLSWMATDEEILNQSTHGMVRRDPGGLVRNPDWMYRPYLVREQDCEINVIFRDRFLSNRIAGHYQGSRPQEAVD